MDNMPNIANIVNTCKSFSPFLALFFDTGFNAAGSVASSAIFLHRF